MSRFLTSTGILLGLIAVSILSLLLLKSECRQYAAYAQETAAAFDRGDTAAALAAFDRLEAEWEDFHNKTGLFVDGGKLDAIHDRILTLRPLIAAGHSEVPAELESVRQLIAGIYEEELPVIWHIL